jgi:superfamily II DNA helicase RecQ
VHWVIHVGAPDWATAFAQESGWAGRDGSRAWSVILLNTAWQPQLELGLSPDQEAIQLYLT